ncbi:PTS glucose transporter subunit IIA, partial [Paenibacillus sp. EKM208P]
AAATVLTLIFGYESKVKGEAPETVESVKTAEPEPVVTATKVVDIKKETIYSPITGRITPLSQVNDSAFSTGAMGKGLAIEPSVGEVVAPIDGV